MRELAKRVREEGIEASATRLNRRPPDSLTDEVQMDLGEARKAGRTKSRLKRLLRDVDPRLPERRAFLEQIAQTVRSPRRRES